MKKCLIIANASIQTDPRPYRMHEWLKESFQVDSIAFNKARGHKPWAKILRKARYFFCLLFRRYEEAIDFKCLKDFKEKSYDLIICHDLTLLPWVIKNKKKSKVVFDAREYYPKQREHSLLWKLLFQKQNIYLCSVYLKEVDLIITVSEGLAAEYKKVFHAESFVIPSFSDFKELSPQFPDKDKIKIIHHGTSSKNRLLENMIYIMDNLDTRFELDLMLVNTDKKYFEFLHGLAAKRKNVRVIPPVPLNEIVSYINKYDIGLFDTKPTTFNLEYCLPNKFFEFIQGRLMIAVGPFPEMAAYVKKFSLGVVASDYDPHVMANIINSLTIEEIHEFKNNAHKAANVLCSEENKKVFLSLIAPLTHE